MNGWRRGPGAVPGEPGPEPVPPGADEPLDGVDIMLLDEIGRMAEADDPMPEGLVERIVLAAGLMRGFDDEVARLSEVVPELAEVRGQESENRTITFDSDALTIMISISPARSAHEVQIDGWLAPPAEHRVEVRSEGGSLTAFSDAQGRFSLDNVPHGLAQLVVHPVAAAQGMPSRSVTTPSIVL